MFDFELQRCTRQCAKTARELLPGQAIYSVLVADGPDVKRLDYAVEAWQQPPDSAIAWWKSHIPGGGNKRAQWAPHEVILGYLERLAGDESKADVRYVLALFMIRRRIVRLEHTERDEAGREVLVLFSPRQEMEFRVPVVMPSDERAVEIQNELSELLVTPAL